jgi:pilus assembly protein CpaC
MTMVRLQHRLGGAILVSLFLFLLVAVGAAAAGDKDTLTVPLGESQIIAVANLERVAVADPGVADVVVASASEVIVNGKKPGITSLHLWEAGQRRSFLVKVEANVDPAAKAVAEAVNDPAVQVKAAQGTILLEGTVADQAAAERAEKVARAYSDKVVNLLRWPASLGTSAGTGVSPEAQAAEKAEKDRLEAEKKATEQREAARKAAEREALPGRVEEAVGLSTVKARVVGDVLLVDGKVPTKEAAERAKTIAEAFASGVVGKVSTTLLVQPPEPPQVLLQVQVTELSRDALSELGVIWGTDKGKDNGGFFSHETWIGELLVNRGFDRVTALVGRLQAKSKDGTARLLAAPSILTRSGKQAEFLAGGEIPVVIQGKDGATVYWKDYGVKLSMAPEVREDGMILVHLKPEVSTLDWASGARMNNGLLPALKTRRVETDVQLRDGGTLVVGGLLNSEESKNAEGVPWISKLPILGQLFGSKGFQSGQTQLVIFVTPRLVKLGETPAAADVMTPPIKETPVDGPRAPAQALAPVTK